jgi:hypothetical protein
MDIPDDTDERPFQVATDIALKILAAGTAVVLTLGLIWSVMAK